MKDILIGNICSLGAMVTDSIGSIRRKNNEMLGFQILSQIFYAAGSILLKGYSSTAQNVVAVFRNLAAIKNIQNKAIEGILIASGVILGVFFNNRGVLGWLPIVANFIYSVSIFRFKDDETKLKISFLLNMVMFAAFNLVIKNYVSAASNSFVAVTTLLSLIKDRKA